jgi:transcriptional regulator with XRE-family HTH domain
VIYKFDVEFIKKRREELGISQQEMARKIGFSGASIYCRYEKGQYTFSAPMIPLIAKALKVSINKLFKKEAE